MVSINSLYFSYDGIKSIDKGVYLVKIDSGLKENPLLPEREIISEQIFGQETPYYFGFIDRPLRFSVTISPLEDEWTTEKRREIARWLNPYRGKFAEFYTTDDINKIYFVTYLGSPNLSLTGLNQGYVTLEFQNIDQYTYTPVHEKIYDFSTIVSPTIFHYENMGDTLLYPDEMWIQKIGDGDLSIISLSDGGREFKFTNLFDNEIVYVRNKDAYIESSIPDRYLYSNFNMNYLRMVYGVNVLQVSSPCKIKIRTRFALKG